MGDQVERRATSHLYVGRGLDDVLETARGLMASKHVRLPHQSMLQITCLTLLRKELK